MNRRQNSLNLVFAAAINLLLLTCLRKFHSAYLNIGKNPAIAARIGVWLPSTWRRISSGGGRQAATFSA